LRLIDRLTVAAIALVSIQAFGLSRVFEGHEG
jgi:hypothetical protein